VIFPAPVPPCLHGWFFSDISDWYEYINDTLCIGKIIVPVGTSDFIPVIARWNMNTGEVIPMKYAHPEIEKRRISFALSVENGIYVDCYNHHDLLSICTLDGELKYNIYGPKWDNRKSNRKDYFHKGFFHEDKLIILYTGEEPIADKGHGNEWNPPTKLMVFNLNGDYIKTIETGYRLQDFCFDEENNRILMSMDDDIQFGYLNLDGII
jgi:hypothetical protein